MDSDRERDEALKKYVELLKRHEQDLTREAIALARVSWLEGWNEREKYNGKSN